jgi:NTP pyrophosphatase (non-canonical NTP hydrolase)
MTPVRLDDMYKMVAHIYAEQNLPRSIFTTFSHFVEVCGMLTIHDRKKKKEGVTVTDALCKALGWYFPLMAKLRVRSVEELVFRKFPYACPYCRLAPHRDSDCKVVRGTAPTVDHSALQTLYYRNHNKRPNSLNGWQSMFQEIYPRSVEDKGRSTVGLLEELGELAEAIRVFEKHPKYFAGEAADIFSYLMGIANEHAIRLAQEEDVDFSFEDEFLRRYPGLCTQCGSKSCVCPSVPEATVGRMTKELDIAQSEELFVTEPEAFADEARNIAHTVLEDVGGYVGLADQFPFDRGDANKGLMMLCLKLADAVHEQKPKFADALRAEALKIGSSATYAGSRQKSLTVEPILELVRQIWRELDQASRQQIRGSTNQLVAEISDLIGKIRVLFVYCSPKDSTSLRVSGELRTIEESIKLGPTRDHISIKSLPAATIDDLRRMLLREEFEVVHFSGHSNRDVLVFEDASGNSTPAPIEKIGELLRKYKSIRCVILNSCESASNLPAPIGPLTIGMEATIPDEAAIEFSRGFYDALAAGKTFEDAVLEGKQLLALKGLVDKIKVLGISKQSLT